MKQAHVDWSILVSMFSVPAARRAVDPVLMSERGKDSAASRKVRKLLEEHPSINVEKDSAGGWWVTCDDFEDERDPLDGANWCSSWRDVLESVEFYIEQLG
jgi:hypothetical protein